MLLSQALTYHNNTLYVLIREMLHNIRNCLFSCFFRTKSKLDELYGNQNIPNNSKAQHKTAAKSDKDTSGEPHRNTAVHALLHYLSVNDGCQADKRVDAQSDNQEIKRVHPTERHAEEIGQIIVQPIKECGGPKQQTNQTSSSRQPDGLT